MRDCVFGDGHLQTLVHIRSGRGGLTYEPGTVRNFRKPLMLMWHARALIPVRGSTGPRERSEPLAGASRRRTSCQLSIPKPLFGDSLGD
jgi:hypothetical protein